MTVPKLVRSLSVARIGSGLRHHRLARTRAKMRLIAKGLGLGLLAAALGTQPVFAVDNDAQLSQSAQHHFKLADFKHESASREARQVADWVVDSGDNGHLPFVIVDKVEAKVFVFFADGRLRGAAPALLGLALGDESV